MTRLTDQVRTVPGIGPKKAAALQTAGIQTLADVLRLYPRGYEDRTHITPIAEVAEGEKACILAVAGTMPVVRHIRKGMDITKFTVFDESGTIGVTYFNNRYTAALIKEGETYLFYGKVQGQGRNKTLVSPAFEAYHGQRDGGIVPVYPLTAGIGQKDMQRITKHALEALENSAPEDCLPTHIRRKMGFAEIGVCLREIHRPQSIDEMQRARRRIIFEELFLLCCGLARLRVRRKGEPGLRFENTELTGFWNALPFAPTGAQRRAAETITNDLKTGEPMNRLVQGDVGSGKTAVAAALCALAAQNGFQAAFMAPTEILAAQHAKSLAPMLEVCGISSVLLTGAMRAGEKREAMQRIAAGDAQVVIGTHALIQKDVAFANLGAVVVDEQHRFGVSQRAALSAKGRMPHVLVMSATPIPRTLALILYGDLDVSVLNELPPGRTPVETYAVGENMRARIDKFIEKQCAAGGQVYVVCPRVEDGEDEEPNLKSAQEHAETIQKKLPHRRVGVLHGRMKAADKDLVMDDFAAGKIDILVATTVIEVGVNVPNATLMVVEDADRFGLSQLHQLRGRVGRGSRKSYCIFFGADRGQTARERLETLCKTTDGFEIAKADLAHRGPGDFFGSRQHGLPALHVADLAGDMAVLHQAQEEAAGLLAEDALLEGYPALKARVMSMFSADEQGDIFN